MNSHVMYSEEEDYPQEMPEQQGPQSYLYSILQSLVDYLKFPLDMSRTDTLIKSLQRYEEAVAGNWTKPIQDPTEVYMLLGLLMNTNTKPTYSPADSSDDF